MKVRKPWTVAVRIAAVAVTALILGSGVLVSSAVSDGYAIRDARIEFITGELEAEQEAHAASVTYWQSLYAQAIEQLNEQGADASVLPTPVEAEQASPSTPTTPGPQGLPGLPGPVGAPGPAPTAEQIAEAVAAYCASGVCVGASGSDGVSPTAEQVAAAVAAYCASGACTGGTGATGPTGLTGASVTNVQCMDLGAGFRFVFTITAADGSSIQVDSGAACQPAGGTPGPTDPPEEGG